MPPLEPRHAVLIAALSLCLSVPAGLGAQEPAQQPTFGFGELASPEQIAGWDIDTRPPGVGMPEGSGSVAEGRELYNQTCVACHGEDGQGPMDRLVGGAGTLDEEKPVKTVGSYWPYATTLFDYIRRAMPFDHPHSLTMDQVYAAAAYVLYMNDLVPEDAVMNAETLPKVEMRNREGFYGPDPRPDVHNWPCMRNCEPLSPEAGETETPTQSEVQ